VAYLSVLVSWQQLHFLLQAPARHGPAVTLAAHSMKDLLVIHVLYVQSSTSVKSLAKSVSEVSLKGSDSKADLVQDQSPRTVTGAHGSAVWSCRGVVQHGWDAWVVAAAPVSRHSHGCARLY
jgi:hypothetical protein